ncbi:MAG: hypothetical protein AB1Z38_04750 [Desulfotignum sp.]
MTFKKIWPLLFICMVLQLPGEAESKPCFMSVFYDKMFKQTPLQSEKNDNPILVAESDPLTALGNTAVCHDEGCNLSHTNNGRFDLLLRNTAAEGNDQVPLSLIIHQIRIGFQDLEGQVSSQWVQIGKQQIGDCFGTPISFKKGSPFNAAAGLSANPEFLEPGEGIIGCVCVSQQDRRKTGKAIIEVRYEPAVWMLDLSKNGQAEQIENSFRWRAQHKVHDLAQDHIRFFKFTVPHEPQDLIDIQITLENAQGLEIFYRMADHGWSRNIDGWQPGTPALSGENAGKTAFLLVRSTRSSASGTLAAEYMTRREITGDAGSAMGENNIDGFAPTPVGQSSTRIFKAFSLGTGDEGRNDSATPSCCGN